MSSQQGSIEGQELWRVHHVRSKGTQMCCPVLLLCHWLHIKRGQILLLSCMTTQTLSLLSPLRMNNRQNFFFLFTLCMGVLCYVYIPHTHCMLNGAHVMALSSYAQWFPDLGLLSNIMNRYDRFCTVLPATVINFPSPLSQ